MTTEFSVLEHFYGHCGHLTKVQPARAGIAHGSCQWLWIEGGSVCLLQLADDGTADQHCCDYAVLTPQTSNWALSWPHGRIELLVHDTANALNAECLGLIHQHLN
jgi:hypothetical protein